VGTVYAYLKVFEHWEEIIPLVAKGMITTLKDALAYIKKLEREGEPPKKPEDDPKPKAPVLPDGRAVIALSGETGKVGGDIFETNIRALRAAGWDDARILLDGVRLLREKVVGRG
jgi:hypothetical protein